MNDFAAVLIQLARMEATNKANHREQMARIDQLFDAVRGRKAKHLPAADRILLNDLVRTGPADLLRSELTSADLFARAGRRDAAALRAVLRRIPGKDDDARTKRLGQLLRRASEAAVLLNGRIVVRVGDAPGGRALWLFQELLVHPTRTNFADLKVAKLG